jgi:hypothetical protein
MPTKIYSDWNRPYENEYRQNQELFIVEHTDGKINFYFVGNFNLKLIFFIVNPQTKILLENEKPTISANPFERLRPLDLQIEPTITITPPLIRPLKSSLEKMQHDFDDNNDSSTSTTNRSIHLPVEKQRGISEIIRKRNSRYKVEDYKRSFQKSNTFDELQPEYYRPLPISKSDYTLSNNQTSISNISSKQMNRLNKTKSVDISIEYDKPTQISNEYVINSYSGVACHQSENFLYEIEQPIDSVFFLFAFFF